MHERVSEVNVYGQTVTVLVLVIYALWYVAAGSDVVRHVVVRDFPGHEKDDVFVSTDPILTPRHIIESISKAGRWKSALTKRKASSASRTRRTAPSAPSSAPAPLTLISYSLTVLWYHQYGQKTRAAKLPTLPWYTHKASTTFSDMLATLRRACWSERPFDPASSTRDLRKRLRPLVDYVASAA